MWVATGSPSGVKNTWTAFEKATGAKLDVVTIPDVFEDNLLAKWTAGDRPDILSWHAIRQHLLKIQPQKNLVDLTGEPFVQQTKFNLLDTVGSVDGHVYEALTTYPYLTGVFYNRDVFARLGLKIPNGYSQLIDLCKEIQQKDPSIAPITAGGADQWPLNTLAYSYLSEQVQAGIEDGLNDGTVKFTDPRIIAGFEALKNAQDQGCYEKDIATSTYIDQVSRLFNGESAMVVQGHWMLPDLIDSFGAENVNKTIGFFPVSAEGQLINWQAVQIGTYSVPINTDAAKQAGALAFIRFVTGPGYQQYLDDSGDLPVLEGYDSPSNVSAILKEANSYFEKGGVNAWGVGLRADYGNLPQLLNQLITGQKTTEQVGQAQQEAFDAAVKLQAP